MVKGSSLVDRAWTCGCGSLNSHTRETCGGCNKNNVIKDYHNENKTRRDYTNKS
jgi:hypothetical protein